MGRFAVSLLDINNKSKAKPQEVLIDKKVGEIYYNSGTEDTPNLISFDESTRKSAVMASIAEASHKVFGIQPFDIVEDTTRHILNSTVNSAKYVLKHRGKCNFFIYADVTLFKHDNGVMVPVSNPTIQISYQVYKPTDINDSGEFLPQNVVGGGGGFTNPHNMTQNIGVFTNFAPSGQAYRVSVAVSPMQNLTGDDIMIVNGVYLVTDSIPEITNYHQLDIMKYMMRDKPIKPHSNHGQYKKGDIVIGRIHDGYGYVLKIYRAIRNNYGHALTDTQSWKELTSDDMISVFSDGSDKGGNITIYPSEDIPSDKTEIPELYGIASMSSKLLIVDDSIMNEFLSGLPL